jgi:hypothetical protein
MQFWRYQRLAIQLDAAHGKELAEPDKARDLEVEQQGYETVSLRPGDRGYHEEVRRLVERIDTAMQMAKTDPLEVAVEATVLQCMPPG